MNIHTTEPHAKHQPRVEDRALITGEGRFIDDVAAPGQAYGVFVRSPHAFARIRSIDVAAARSAPGVLAVLTAAEMTQGGVGDMARHPPMEGRHGSNSSTHSGRRLPASECCTSANASPWWSPSAGLVRAMDGAELVTVEYEEIEPVVDLSRRCAPGARNYGRRPRATSRSTGSGPADDGSKAREARRRSPTGAHVARVRKS